jgi:site-specific recombinase XerD
VLEKGGKTAVKPISNELVEILTAAFQSGDVDCRADSYVIPNRRAASVRRKERSSKVVWETVREVAERVGVTANVHALRRAFAVAFLTSHPGALESLQALLNHSRIDTTQVYLRALNRSKAMEAVRDLSWGSVFPSLKGKAHTGFEPVPPP